MTNGKLVVIEGIDGSGKSTLIANLVTELTKKGYKAIAHQEPGTTEMGIELRKLIKSKIPRSKLTEILMFEASRSDTVETVLKADLETYDYVIMDRYIDSTTAYQGYGNQNPLETIAILNEIAIGDVKPDYRILLDVDMETAYNRRNIRTIDTVEHDKFDSNYQFAKRVYDGYQVLVAEGLLTSIPNIELNNTTEQIIKLIQ